MVAFKISFSVISLLAVFCRVSQAKLTWVVQSDLGADVADKSSHDTLLQQLVKKDADELSYHFLTELNVMASGNDFYGFSGVDGVNAEQHAQAKALVTLHEKLHATKKVSDIINEATKYGAEQVKSTGDIKNAMTFVYEKAENLLKNDPQLYNEYVALKGEAKKQVTGADHVVYYGLVPATIEEAKKILYQAVSHPLTKEEVANAVFVKQSEAGAGANPETVALVKAILEVASIPEKRNSIEAVYEASLHETAKNVKDSNPDEQQHFQDYIQTLLAELIKTLEAKIKSDPNLSADVEAAKKKISS